MKSKSGSLLLRGLLLALMISGLGCSCHVQQLQPSQEDVAHICQRVPDKAKNNVHIFLLQGNDYLDCSDLKKLKGYLHGLGFNQVWYGHSHHASAFAKTIREHFYHDPEARFVLIGNGWGAVKARDLASELKEEGIYFELLVYLGGVMMQDGLRDRPENVVRVRHILGWGWCFDGHFLNEAENLVLPVHHSALPTHAKTKELLAFDLGCIAGTIPVEVPMPTLELPQGIRPSKELPLPEKETSEEWNFLQPTAAK